MQIDSPTVRRLRDMLLERAQLELEQRGEERRLAHAETSPEVQALVERIAPICETLYLVMTADGTTDANETLSIRGAIDTLTANGLSRNTVDAMLARFERDAVAYGPSGRLHQVAALLSADREDAEAALALAAAVAMADGTVARTEESVLIELAESLGISTERAARILDTAQ
jgi:tellurite resistance protein